METVTLIDMAVKEKYPNTIAGLSASRIDFLPDVTNEQKAAVISFIGGLDLDLLAAQSKYAELFQEFNANTASIEAKGFSYQGGIFHADDKGVRNMQSLTIASAGLAYPYTIYDNDSTWTFNSQSELATMGAAVIAFVAGLEVAARPLRDDLKQKDGESSSAWLARLNSYADPRSI